jgi:hypothetical protein
MAARSAGGAIERTPDADGRRPLGPLQPRANLFRVDGQPEMRPHPGLDPRSPRLVRPARRRRLAQRHAQPRDGLGRGRELLRHRDALERIERVVQLEQPTPRQRRAGERAPDLIELAPEPLILLRRGLR